MVTFVTPLVRHIIENVSASSEYSIGTWVSILYCLFKKQTIKNEKLGNIAFPVCEPNLKQDQPNSTRIYENWSQFGEWKTNLNLGDASPQKKIHKNIMHQY